METNRYISDLAIHPGEFLEETLEAIGMSQAELSDRLGRPVQAINEIIKGKKSITPATALELEDVLGIPSHIWIGLESEYQIVMAKQAELKQMEEESALLPKFPYADLVKLGFVQARRNGVEKVEELRRLFGVAKLGQIGYVKAYQPAFRVSNHKEVSHEAIATWIQAGRIRAKEIETKPFDKKKLKVSLPLLKELMNLKSIAESIQKIKTTLAECGVAFVLLPHFPKTRVNGATFWIDENNKAVIMMSIRGGYSDIFWFSFFHEIGHILLHNKREIFLEDGYNDPSLQKQENEANAFAGEFLIPQAHYDRFVQERDFSRTALQTFAKQMGIKSSIVVGRLMHDELIAFNDYRLNGLRDKYQWEN